MSSQKWAGSVQKGIVNLLSLILEILFYLVSVGSLLAGCQQALQPLIHHIERANLFPKSNGAGKERKGRG